MKKCWLLFLAVVMISGCADQEVFEQVEDVYQVMAPQAAVLYVQLPEEAAVTAMGSGQENAIYFCDGYTLTVQTLAGGDLDRTLRQVTGYAAERLTLLQTGTGETERYECAWTSAGEGGDQVGRLVLLDDGANHYAVTVMAPAETAGELSLTWDTVLDSVTLGDTGT